MYKARNVGGRPAESEALAGGGALRWPEVDPKPIYEAPRRLA